MFREVPQIAANAAIAALPSHPTPPLAQLRLTGDQSAAHFGDELAIDDILAGHQPHGLADPVVPEAAAVAAEAGQSASELAARISLARPQVRREYSGAFGENWSDDEWMRRAESFADRLLANEGYAPQPPPAADPLSPGGPVLPRSKYTVEVSAAGGEELLEAVDKRGIDVLQDWYGAIDQVTELPQTRLVSTVPEDPVVPDSMRRESWVVPKQKASSPFSRRSAQRRSEANHVRRQTSAREVMAAPSWGSPGPA
jgi:hypothetical protein